MSKLKIKISSTLVGLLFLLGSYQNCALHRSDGRKQLETLLSRQQSSVVPSSCLPYLSTQDTDIIFSDTTEAELSSSTGVPTCNISANKDLFGAEVAICTLIQDPKFQLVASGIAAANTWTVYNNKAYYYKSPTEYVEKVITDSTPAIPAGQERFYGVAVQNGTYLSYHFIAADAEMGVECRFSVDKVQFDSDIELRKELAKRGSSLMHKLYTVCIDNRNCSF